MDEVFAEARVRKKADTKRGTKSNHDRSYKHLNRCDFWRQDTPSRCRQRLNTSSGYPPKEDPDERPTDGPSEFG
jgi:hypothetical protein